MSLLHQLSIQSLDESIGIDGEFRLEWFEG